MSKKWSEKLEADIVDALVNGTAGPDGTVSPPEIGDIVAYTGKDEEFHGLWMIDEDGEEDEDHFICIRWGDSDEDGDFSFEEFHSDDLSFPLPQHLIKRMELVVKNVEER
jgi:hypothetical protein